MADEIPVIPKAENILAHTGNIVNWIKLKKKVTQSPQEELATCIESTISEWSKTQDKNELQYATNLECQNTKLLDKLPEEGRNDFKVTVKIFLTSKDKSAACDAVDRALSDLGTSHIETVLISLPESRCTVEELKPIWETLEEYVRHNKVLSLGVSDLSKSQLEELYNWAEFKPLVAQVNLLTCCVVPTEMQEFAKEHDIQLLTHNDPSDILPKHTFQSLLLKSFTARDAENWEPAWVARYSALIKCRGIIKSKGFIMKAERDIKKRK